ncbi:MAG: hypothetical protein JWN46_1448 [Acidimicrobiales bacterium]|nr:hypothetical protein [Acidimicrobiales bacterium]
MPPTPTTRARRARALRALLLLAVAGLVPALSGVSAGSASAASSRLAAASAPARAAAVPDPGTTGPLVTTTQDYDFGDSALTFPGLPGPVEDRARVYRPVDLSGGPFPLVIFLHGRHEFCTSGDPTWPCTSPSHRVSSYRGYDGMALNLASHGFVVASISANGINAADAGVEDGGADARGRLILHHLDRWKTWSSSGGAPFGSTYVGKIDLSRIGLMGHSRGGEGVAAAVQQNQALPTRYGIKAVLLLAPVDFMRRKVHAVHLGVILPYCDGDVSDLQGVHYVDDTLYDNPNDYTNRNTILIDGANHNFFNTEWTPPAPTGFDDGPTGSGSVCDRTAPGNQRLSPVAQRAAGLAYVNGFMRRYVTADASFAPLFDGSTTKPASIGGASVLIGYHSTQVDRRRLDVARTNVTSEVSRDTLGGSVTSIDLFRDVCGQGGGSTPPCLGNTGVYGTEPHGGEPGLNQMRVAWGSTNARLRFEVPAAKGDVTGFTALTFRTALNFGFSNNPIGVQTNLRVALVDQTGKGVIVNAATYSNALRYAPGWENGSGEPKLLLNTVRVPLSAFAGVDLHNVRRVTIVFDRRGQGVVQIANLAFADRP